MMSDLMNKNTSQRYSSVKRMTSYGQQKFQKVVVQEINNLSDKDQAEKIAENFLKIPNELNRLRKKM